MNIRLNRSVMIALALGIAFGALAMWWHLSRVESGELADLQRRTAEADARSLSDSLKLLRLDSINARLADSIQAVAGRRDTLRIYLREARSATQQTAEDLRGYLVDDPVGSELLASHLRGDSILESRHEERHVQDSLYAALWRDRAVIFSDSIVPLLEDRITRETALRREWQAVAERLDRQLHPPLLVRASREGTGALAAFAVARYGFDVPPAESALIGASIPLARCAIRLVPLVGKSLSDGCVFEGR